MFNHKKFLAALLCTPLFTACVVNGDDTDDVGNTDTDPTNATLTTSAGTGDESSGTLTTTPGTEESESGSESVDSGSSDEGSTGEPPAGGGCLPACTEAADCCTEGDKACAADPAAYPYTWSCDAGACNYAGCTDDAECDSVIPGTVCSQIEGFGGVCETPCETDAECTVPSLAACLDDGEGGLTCQPGPCAEDVDCGGEGTCEEDGTCTYPGCADDAECGTVGVCDIATGACGCADDTECMEGFTCAE